MTFTAILNFVNTIVTCSMKHKKEFDIYERAGIKQRPTLSLVNAIFRNDISLNNLTH